MIEFNAGAGRVGVTAGRVELFDLGSEAVRVVSGPDDGNVSVNPDGTVALVLRDPDFRGQTSFTVELKGGRTVEVPLKVESGPQEGGWGDGDHYMLERDDDGVVQVEPGENHRKVYVTGGDDGLTLADIARMEGVSVGEVTGRFLAERPEYGATEGKALATEAGLHLWDTISGRDADVNSNWLLLERGHAYTSDGFRIVDRGASGESPLHPMLIGAWGKGEAPVIDEEFTVYQKTSENVVIQDVKFTGSVLMLNAQTVLLDGIEVTGDKGMNIQKTDQFTLHRSKVVDVIQKESDSPGRWDGGDNKISGVFIRASDGALVERTLADHVGWGEGYDPAGSTDDPQPPNKFSHNFYIQKNLHDFTFRDNVSMQAASTGAQLRSGGFIEGNAFVANNVSALVGGGKEGSGDYSLVLDNLVTLAGYKEVDYQIGALSLGMVVHGEEASLLENIVAHLTDPEDTAARAHRTRSDGGLNIRDTPFIDDTVVYNWMTENKRDKRQDFNVPENVPEGRLLDTTVKSFVEDVLGRNGGIDGVDALSDWLRANWTEVDGAGELIEYFQSGFGFDIGVRTQPAALRFIPDERGEGHRWDNPLNWSTEDKPIDGDRVDLGGNWVTYGGETLTLKGVDLGDRGILTVRQGRLETDDLQAGADAALKIGLAGQLWTDGYAGPALEIEVSGGRLANTGTFSSQGEVTVSGGEMLLATGGAAFALSGRMTIDGSSARVGFDGPGGTGALTLADGAELAFLADGEGTSAIREFRSGAWGTDAPGIRSTVDLGDGGAQLTLDLAAFRVGQTTVLLDVDEIKGGFGEIVSAGAAIRVDYGADLIEAVRRSGPPTLELAGSGAAEVFHVADGAETTISGYGSGDVIDLSGVAAAGAGLVARDLGSGMSEIRLDGGKALARVGYGAGIDELKVAIGGATRTLDVTAAPDPGPDPDPVPEPEPEPEPEPDPDPDNTAPEAQRVVVWGAAKDVIGGTVTATDGDGDALTFELVSGPDVGSVSFGPDGSFVYDPEGAFDFLGESDNRVVRFEYAAEDGFGGRDTAQIKVKVQGTSDPGPGPDPEPEPEPEPEPKPDPDPDNTAPEAERVVVWGAAKDVIGGTVTATDGDGDALTFELVSGPDVGSVSFGSDGSFVYDPEGAFDFLGESDNRVVRFEYAAEDGAGGRDTAQIKVKVLGTSDSEPQPDPEPEPEPEPAYNIVTGTAARDRVRGTAEDDAVHAGGGAYDQVWGNGGNDVFVFGAEAEDDEFDFATVMDFDAANETLVLESGAGIAEKIDTDTGVWLTLEGDGDWIFVEGAGVTLDTLKVVETDEVWIA